jgi:hypothetical protein
MRFKRFGFAAVAAMFVVSGAYAQTAAPATPDAAAAPVADAAATKVKAKVKPKAKAKTDAAKPAAAKAKKLPFVTVTVKNGRSAGLTLLTATISGGNGDPVKMTGALASGKSATAHLAHEKDCLFDLHGDFDDGASMDETAVDLCKDKKLNLVD